MFHIESFLQRVSCSFLLMSPPALAAPLSFFLLFFFNNKVTHRWELPVASMHWCLDPSGFCVCRFQASIAAACGIGGAVTDAGFALRHRRAALFRRDGYYVSVPIPTLAALPHLVFR